VFSRLYTNPCILHSLGSMPVGVLCILYMRAMFSIIAVCCDIAIVCASLTA